MAVNLNKFYQTLPVFLQNFVCILYGKLTKRRCSGAWETCFDQFLANERLNQSQLQLIRQQNLKEHLLGASQLQYWANLFDKYHVNLASDDILAEYHKLPILKKDQVREHTAAFINKFSDEPFINAHTSGSTGAGLVFPMTRLAE